MKKKTSNLAHDITEEQAGHDHYMSMAKKTGKKVFKSMAKDEAKHKKLLVKMNKKHG